ncbi:MAG: LacI family DNA-binding transcriptional regulator [Lachnospiraceae bacterium]|nr:LacI family DNA-binding transcriptional regulator [Lachnospiraceae bacterium]
MLKPQKVTLEDVAKDAGVGKGTVDRVIHNRGYVSEEARRKVEQSIKKLGYQLNPVASLLARDR